MCWYLWPWPRGMESEQYSFCMLFCHISYIISMSIKQRGDGGFKICFKKINKQASSKSFGMIIRFAGLNIWPWTGMSYMWIFNLVYMKYHLTKVTLIFFKRFGVDNRLPNCLFKHFTISWLTMTLGFLHLTKSVTYIFQGFQKIEIWNKLLMLTFGLELWPWHVKPSWRWCTLFQGDKHFTKVSWKFFVRKILCD